MSEIITPEEASQINNEAERMFEKAYHELIYAVQRKFPNETRHETALRYIREKETLTGIAQQQSDNGERR